VCFESYHIIMQAMPSDLSSCSSAVPAALEELLKSHASVQQIAQYCKSAYGEDGDRNAVYEQTKNYTNDALQNVVYHVHNVGLQITNFLEVQTKEIERLDLQIKTLSDRMKACHDATGSSDKQKMEASRSFVSKGIKMRKLEGADVPYAAQPLQPFVRSATIDLNALDNVGLGNTERD